MWAESQPGPSRCTPCRRGYCAYCRVLYSDLDQHLSSLRHQDCVQASSRVSTSCSFADSSQAKATLLERFLQDVVLHHPHCYNDPRPSHADLPSVSTPLLPREELDEVCFSDDDLSLGTREYLPSSNNVSTNQEENADTCSQLEKRTSMGPSQERPFTQLNEQEDARTIHSGHTNLPKQALAPLHRKAHRKTDRRKTKKSLTSILSPECPHPGTFSVPQPWQSCHKEQWAAFKEEVISSPHDDLLDQTIEEVIQTCCHGDSLNSCPLEETDSFHVSLPHSLQTQSDWDSPGQVDSYAPLVQTQVRDFSHLTDVQVDLTDQVYSHQLESALHSKHCTVQHGVFRTVPREVPNHLPESFRGKSWAQIEEEDEKKVDDLVRQFRQGRFVCYFDSESLARYGTRSKDGNGPGHTVAESNMGVFPLLNHDEEEVPRRRDFRMASRCQVVKVSHATQTVRLVVPTVCQPGTKATSTSVPPGDRAGVEKTPEMRWSRLPPAYSPVLAPLQSSTSLVYLLCSPTFPAITYTPAASPTPKRSRKKHPPDFHRLKVKYKQFPVRFYDHRSNRIIKNPPKGFKVRKRSIASPLPPCVRQLFRSLSPDLNTERWSREDGLDSPRVKSQRLSSTPSTNSTQTPKHETSPPVHRSRSEEVRSRSEVRPSRPKRRVKVQTTPPPPRRGGLRQKETAPLYHTEPNLRRGRSQRGRACEKTPK
ncbi:DBF4-type zinc finger-containing protein 2 [Phyllopteryx taeniolatus]|uniref:DBF4-type zinc finger-containing protein 2 n=1 Tax=Phyllopteryx taeniolatus TaxID=161469 RepID=UPI002AD3F2B2|nr:DBF4-type zinc finger-containing protein 2 [Phyllopteryx taeniolatus]XP_061642362.1 DBF4-type zinc finger-containing protein 2 [Phyllopteryx taeniolatus]XP_061642372.1 DBF4-type zinc finger-containing protein 2 [Phyllopteryx taeniolatus]XP_061642381.1 DBF4-type zinc finger-containing protein 2 [Phyllopteryx taeniolatus]